MARVQAREYAKAMTQEQTIEVEPGVEFLVRGGITDAELHADGLLPPEAYPSVRGQNDPDRVEKGVRSNVHIEDAKLRAAMVDPRYEPVSDDPDVLTRKTLRNSHRQAILAWIDGGYLGLKRQREQHEGEGSVSGQQDDKHTTERVVRPVGDVRPERSPMPGLRPVDSFGRDGMGDGGGRRDERGEYAGGSANAVV